MRTPHNPLHCFVPPHVLDQLSRSPDPEIRQEAVDTLAVGAEARAVRSTLMRMPRMAAIPSPGARKYRLVYDMRQQRFPLPGNLVFSESDDLTRLQDDAAKEAYTFSGDTHDFYQQIFRRNSLDNNGMTLVSSVHYGRGINNAFWNGEQMLYGDGDNRIFVRFTQAIDVVAHELTHGVITFTSNLEYQNESGALNEHFADVMSALVKQWARRQTARDADWRMGDALMVPRPNGAKSIRTFKEEKAYENDPLLGTDPQPKHYKDRYTGSEDNGGVHINSGIPNHAFYRIALELDGQAWERAGKIWYETLKALTNDSNFQDAASMSYQIAGTLYGLNSREQQAVRNGWKGVGLEV